MIMEKESPQCLKITVEQNDIAEWKGLDKNGNCYFKFDFFDKEDNQKIKIRVPEEIGFEMILLMREQLIKFMGNSHIGIILNSKEKLCFDKLKEALCDNKNLEEKFSLKKSLAYNRTYFGKIGEKINEIEMKQEEALIGQMNFQKQVEKEEYLKIQQRKLLETKND